MYSHEADLVPVASAPESRFPGRSQGSQGAHTWKAFQSKAVQVYTLNLTWSILICAALQCIFVSVKLPSHEAKSSHRAIRGEEQLWWQILHAMIVDNTYLKQRQWHNQQEQAVQTIASK